ALGDYRAGRFEAAMKRFEDIDRDWKDQGSGDPVSVVFIERCKEFLLHPPGPQWNGVFVAKSK
ncbi:MAG: hypothetical protein ABIQ95_16135, partial [Bdellovibrionia bacterium]